MKKNYFFSIGRQRILTLLLVTFTLVSATTTVTAQRRNVVIQGHIVDERTKEAIIGANVFLPSERTGDISDSNGSFQLTARTLPTTLTVSFIGYRTQELEVYSADQPVTIYLREDFSLLNEVVVVGYGTQKRKELTGAIASVPAASLQQAVTSFDNALSGVVAGLNVTQSSGQPGATSTVRIRGGNSITGGNEPLYVIDGFILYNDNNSTRTGGGKFDGGLNPLSSLNAGDIESIEVLKDVSATAIYGSRGANGVILITTRKGHKGSNTVNYQLTLGTQHASRKLDLLNAAQWGELYNELTAGSDVKSVTADEIALAAGSDWQDAALRSGSSQNHQLSISGGDERTRYLISGNYNHQEGILLNTGFTRYAGRLNFDRDLSRNLVVGVNISAAHAAQEGLTNLSANYSAGRVAGPFDYALRLSPVIPVYAPDGKFNYANRFETGDFNIGGRTVNPISDLINTQAVTENTSFIGNFFAQYTLLPGLVAKINTGVNLSNTVQNFYAPSTSAAGLLTQGYGSIGNKKANSSQVEVTLNYTNRLSENHALDLLAGYTTQQTHVQYSAASASNFPNESLGYKNLAGASTLVPATSGAYESVLNSLLGRVNYTFLDRYNLTATLRGDASSRFAAKHRLAVFPSLGLSWNIDQEPFFRSNTTTVKLRLSTGQVGNQEIGDYKYEGTYTPILYSLGGKLVTGYERKNRSNPDLRWETTTQHNVGLDVAFAQGRYAFTLDAYSKKTTDLLVEIPIEITSGFSSELRNVGNVVNRGIEASISAVLIKKRNLSWNVSANIAHNRNEVTSLGGTVPYFLPSFEEYLPLAEVNPLIVKVGEPLGSFYGRIFEGVDAFTGDALFKDINKDGTVNDEDRTVIGNIQPDFTYGFSSTLNWKRFDIALLLQGSVGNQLYNALRHNLETPTTTYNVSTTLLDRWTPDHTNTSVPRAKVQSYINLDDRYIEDASFLRLRNLSFGYTLPGKVVSLPNASLRLALSAQNLLTFTSYSGFDPEASRFGGDESNSLYQGIDLGAYPAARSYLFSLSLTF
ncbi:MAG: TonB-dependent receptor [Tannerellaceae bacterium]|jgi:TonB-linked SusC/RagA family outer membrane protein|nr:TonB-dependent receptor [Tannerellaceae bacterium]